MSSATGDRSLGLDAVHGITVALVVLHHAEVPGFFSGGVSGVTLFFALSGLLITRSLIDHREPVPRFAARRIGRLYPALVVFLAVAGLYAVTHGRGGLHAENAAGVLLGYHNWLRLDGVRSPQVAHLWTLAVELQFYVVWAALVVVAGRRRNHPLLIGVVLAGAVIPTILRLSFFDGGLGVERIYLGTDTRLDAIAVGCLLGLAGWSIGRGAGHVALLAGAACLAAVTAAEYGSLREVYTWGLTVSAVAAGAVILAVQHRSDRWMVPLAWLGAISYGVYLWHFLIIRTFLDRGGAIPQPLWIAGLVVASVGAGWASHRFVERRFWSPSPAPLPGGRPSGAHRWP